MKKSQRWGSGSSPPLRWLPLSAKYTLTTIWNKFWLKMYKKKKPHIHNVLVCLLSPGFRNLKKKKKSRQSGLTLSCLLSAMSWNPSWEGTSLRTPELLTALTDLCLLAWQYHIFQGKGLLANSLCPQVPIFLCIYSQCIWLRGFSVMDTEMRWAGSASEASGIQAPPQLERSRWLHACLYACLRKKERVFCVWTFSFLKHTFFQRCEGQK